MKNRKINLFLKKYLLQFLCNISCGLNLPKYIGPFGRNKIIVLMYHGIIKSYSANPIKNISTYNVLEKEFEKQMAYLAKYCNVISISDIIAGRNISKRKKNLIITFDDGYRNNYLNAFPILLRYKLPALFSLPTAFVTSQQPLWNDVIEYAVATTNKQLVHIKWYGLGFDFRLVTISEKIAFYKWIFAKCIEIRQEERELFIANILQELNVSNDNNELLSDSDYAPLTTKQINIMLESGMIEFASHSVNHFLLSNVNEEVLKSELLNSKLAIERITGVPCKYFTIPGGAYDESVKNEILLNYEKAFSSELTEDRLFETDGVIGRYCVQRHLNMPLFVDLVSGPFQRM